jgi:hypothetical protein
MLDGRGTLIDEFMLSTKESSQFAYLICHLAAFAYCLKSATVGLEASEKISTPVDAKTCYDDRVGLYEYVGIEKGMVGPNYYGDQTAAQAEAYIGKWQNSEFCNLEQLQRPRLACTIS